MLVVADASPFVGLIKIGHVEILSQLFGSVLIPPQVRRDLLKTTQAIEVQSFAKSLPAWLVERTPLKIDPIPGLDAGEVAAISLATEIHADVLLIDETRGRAAAIHRNIHTFRTAAVMKLAADRGFIPDLAEAFARLKQTNFRVPDRALDALLQAHLEAKRK